MEDYITPDSVMHHDNAATKYNAFIWVLDKGKSLLYSQPGNQFHGMSQTHKDANLFKDKDAVACFGRFGKSAKGGFVTIWKYQDKKPINHYELNYQKDSNRGFNMPNKDEIKILLKGLLGILPMKVIGESPATLPITNDYIFSIKGTVQTVAEFIGDTQEQQDPRCKNMKINVQGQLMPLDQIQAQLHMVKGQQLGFLKSAFCSQYQYLKNAADTQHCKIQHNQIDDIASNLKCGSDKDLWKSMLQAGKLDYRQQLKDIFRDPEKINQLRTQKDIDNAWDKLQGENFSFKEWLYENNIKTPFENNERAK